MKPVLVFFLIFIPLFWSSYNVFGYTVVLKNGKRVDGELIREDEKEVQLRDANGLMLKFKRESLDLTAMQETNLKQSMSNPEKKTKVEKTKEEIKPKSLAEQAKEAQKKNTGKAKLLTIEDLEKMPEVSIIGSTQTQEQVEAGNSEVRNNDEQRPKSIPAADEQYWRDRSRKLRSEIESLKDRADEAEKNCEKTGGRRSYELSQSNRYPNSNCKTADDLKAKIEQTEDAVQRLRNEAFDQDIPFEWIQE